MEFVLKDDSMRIPIKVWTDEVEESAMEQAKNLARHPSTFSHVALMADTHLGYGMPIGGIIACEADIIPNAVGVDIGCGVTACKLNMTRDDITEAQIKEWMGAIRSEIPVGFKRHTNNPFMRSVEHLESQFVTPIPKGLTIIQEHLEASVNQIGTLGGGNHFIELQKDLEDKLWIMIHSGSRNIGLQIAKYYHKIATQIRDTYHLNVEKDLSFLPENSPEGYEYVVAMNFAVEFAKLNRHIMLKVAARLLQEIVYANILEWKDVAHNYARLEHHFGKNVWVHRKGATHAADKAICLIPGSQGSASFVGYGTGNLQSFRSCSHGAGRLMGRKKAKQTLDLKEEQLKMEGIFHSVRSEDDLDESVSAYKDINEVMAFQSDLVIPVNTLLPIAVIKG